MYSGLGKRQAQAWHRATIALHIVIIEETNTKFSAYAPNLPGCIATKVDIMALPSTFDMDKSEIDERSKRWIFERI
jgi:hypothetical protein